MDNVSEREDFARGRAWVELHMENLRHNVAALRALLPPGCELMPAIKADAYGHGAAPVARELNRLGVRAFCVATAQEGAALRRQGVEGVILVLGYTHPTQFVLLRRYDLSQTVISASYARLLQEVGEPIQVHIGIDTGMHRLGERWENWDRICAMYRMENLRIGGVLTHLCASDDPGERAYTLEQGAAFWQVVEQLRARGLPCPSAHILGSYGLLHYPELGGDYARVGIALYGALSTREDWDRCAVDLRPVLSLRARVAAVTELRPGETAGYGRAFTAREARKLAVLSIGYGDGLPRALSCGVGRALLRGCAAPIVGRVCMDQTLVDATDIPGVAEGETATLIGRDGELSIRVWDVAEEAGTISNEILSRLGARLTRVSV